MASFPCPEHQRADQRREKRDMQSRDADQMSDAGAVEQQPLRRWNRALVADRQRSDDAGVRLVLERAQNAIAYRLAVARDVVFWPAGKSIEPAIGVVVAHIAGGAQIVDQQPRFDVEAMRVDGSVRALQPDRDRPALAGVQHRPVDGRRADREAAVPGKRHTRRHAGFGGDDAFDGEGKTYAAISRLRQLVDHPDKADIAALPCGRQRIGEPKFGAPRGVEKAAAAGGERENGDCVSRAASEQAP